MLTRAEITLGVLAGGKATRIGGVDKALVEFRGQSLLDRLLANLGAGFFETLLSYNRDPAPLDNRQVIIVPDRRHGSLGPLAGIESLLQRTRSRWLLTLPVDLREIPTDLAERMLAEADDARGVALVDADGLQPLVGLWPVVESLEDIRRALDSGACAVHEAVCRLNMCRLDVSPIGLGNLNTPEALDQ